MDTLGIVGIINATTTTGNATNGTFAMPSTSTASPTFLPAITTISTTTTTTATLVAQQIIRQFPLADGNLPLTESGANFGGNDSFHHLLEHHSQQQPPPAQHPLFLLPSFWLSDDFVPLQEMLSWLLNGPLTLLFVLSGIALNALCVLVFLRFRNTGNGTTPIIHYYLISLACWHSALLCNAFVLYCLPSLLWGSVVSTGPYVHLYPPTYTLANATHTGTVWIILALTLDRYLALCMPFKHRMFSKRSRVKRLVVGLSLLAIVYSLPRFFEVTTVLECTPTALMPTEANETAAGGILPEHGEDCLAYVQRTGLPQNQLYRTLYHILLGSTFVTILPGVLTFVLTLRITIALSEAQRRRKRLSHCEPMRSSETKTTTTTTTTTEKESHSGGRDVENSGGSFNIQCAALGSISEKQPYRTMLLAASNGTAVKKASCLRKKEHRANVMLVVVIVKFLISDILPTVLDVFETFIGNEAFMSSPVATLWVDFSNLLLVLNCSTNFWVFIFYVRGFRQRCARLLAISLRLSPAPNPITTDGNESAFAGSYAASPRASTPQCLLNGNGPATAQNRPRGSAGEYTELAKVALLNNSSSVAPILPLDSNNRDPSFHSIHRLNGGCSGSFSGSIPPIASRHCQQSPRGSRVGSPSREALDANGRMATLPNGLSNGNANNVNFGNFRSKRACSLGMQQQQRTSIGVTITPPTPSVLAMGNGHTS